jgi:hypothetical protein
MAAIPNPVGLISAVESRDPVKLAASVVYMAVDSYTSYKAFTDEAEKQYLQDGWTLDDEESNMLHESRKGTFEYMVDMVKDYGLPGDLALTEKNVAEFVKYKNSSNVASKIQFLESNKGTYQSYGGYWLTLADGYYNNGDFEKCLDAISTYEKIETRIFRHDYEYARVLPPAIAAANEVYKGDQYEEYASEHAKAIIDNTDHSDWALRYFAAETFVDLYSRSRNGSYLQTAYEITRDSVNYLVPEQKNLNSTYLAEVKEREIPKDADDEEKKQIEDYNKMLHDKRNAEVPPVSEPLMLNCDMLFAIAGELSLEETEKTKIDSMLHPKGERLFLTEALDDRYWFGDSEDEPKFEDPDIDFGGTAMVVPAAYVTDETEIEVSVKNPDDDEPTLIKDWKVNRVERGTEGDMSTFQALFTSEKAHDQEWVPNATVKVVITPMAGGKESYARTFKAKGTKKEWYDYLKVWEGHKNHWWDYLKVWENSVVFKSA